MADLWSDEGGGPAGRDAYAGAGELRERAPSEFEIGYRHCALRGGRLGADVWFAAAWFRFRAGNRDQARARIWNDANDLFLRVQRRMRLAVDRDTANGFAVGMTQSQQDGLAAKARRRFDVGFACAPPLGAVTK